MGAPPCQGSALGPLGSTRFHLRLVARVLRFGGTRPPAVCRESLVQQSRTTELRRVQGARPVEGLESKLGAGSQGRVAGLMDHSGAPRTTGLKEVGWE